MHDNQKAKKIQHEHAAAWGSASRARSGVGFSLREDRRPDTHYNTHKLEDIKQRKEINQRTKDKWHMSLAME